MLLPPQGTHSASLVGRGLEKGQPRGHCAGGELCCSLGLAAAPELLSPARTPCSLPFLSSQGEPKSDPERTPQPGQVCSGAGHCPPPFQ